jgi:hypothetical protein
MSNETNPASKCVPATMTFSYKVLRIPTLEEMGIPMAGYGVCTLNERLQGLGYDICWIDRGDPLLKYDFRCFRNSAKPFLAAIRGDPWLHQTFEIISPISGLFLYARSEQTVGSIPGMSLQYECCDELRLPVILVPNDEPPPSSNNFYVYDKIAHFLREYFEMIPVRDRSRTSPERLGDYIVRNDDDIKKIYRAHLNALRSRNPDSHRTYDIRKISAADTELVGRVQHLRSKNIELRGMLVHLARQYGEAI